MFNVSISTCLSYTVQKIYKKGSFAFYVTLQKDLRECHLLFENFLSWVQLYKAKVFGTVFIENF